MDATTVAVDLAKNVFEVAVADADWKVTERARLTRGQFQRWFANRENLFQKCERVQRLLESALYFVSVFTGKLLDRARVVAPPSIAV